MEKLSLHIEFLLQNHECVILPGFGAFISIYEAPHFDNETGVITPPKREIRFNQSLINDDGLLANSFARKLRVSHSEGAQIVSKYVSLLIEALNLDGEVTIGRLGVIKQDPERKYSFHPFNTAASVAAEIGLLPAPFSSPSPLKTSEGKTSDTEYSISRSRSSEKEGVFKDEELTEYDLLLLEKARRLNFKRNYYIPINKYLTKISACLIVATIFILAWMNPSADKGNYEERASVLPIDKVLDSAIREVIPSGKKRENCLCTPDQRDLQSDTLVQSYLMDSILLSGETKRR